MTFRVQQSLEWQSLLPPDYALIFLESRSQDLVDRLWVAIMKGKMRGLRAATNWQAYMVSMGLYPSGVTSG